MTLDIEQYAEYVAAADDVWAVVGDPRRLGEWTDARIVDPPATWQTGDAITTAGAAATTWQVISVGQRVVEVAGDTSCGRVGIGVRVIATPAAAAPAAPSGGCRVVFAATLDPARGALRGRLRDLPALRRRFDRWALALRRLVEG